MKKAYSSPSFEKVEFVTTEDICDLFGDLFGISLASDGNNVFTKDNIFDWENIDKGNN